MEGHGFLGLIQIVIQRSKEVAGGRFSAAAASDMRAAFTLPILGRTPGGKQIHLKTCRGDTYKMKAWECQANCTPRLDLFFDQSTFLGRGRRDHGLYKSGLEQPIQIHEIK